MVEEYKFKYFCNNCGAPVKASAKGKNICAYECGLLNLRDAIDEELKRIGSDDKLPSTMTDDASVVMGIGN